MPSEPVRRAAEVIADWYGESAGKIAAALDDANLLAELRVCGERTPMSDPVPDLADLRRHADTKERKLPDNDRQFIDDLQSQPAWSELFVYLAHSIEEEADALRGLVDDEAADCVARDLRAARLSGLDTALAILRTAERWEW